jgi:hypothetical protein
MEMNAQATKLQGAEDDLKELMADVTRAMEKAQEAVARIASKAAAATTEIDSVSSEPSGTADKSASKEFVPQQNQ